MKKSIFLNKLIYFLYIPCHKSFSHINLSNPFKIHFLCKFQSGAKCESFGASPEILWIIKFEEICVKI